MENLFEQKTANSFRDAWGNAMQGSRVSLVCGGLKVAVKARGHFCQVWWEFEQSLTFSLRNKNKGSKSIYL